MRHKDGECKLGDFVAPENQKSLSVQLVLSLALGSVAFLAFTILRPRWPALYAARKRRLDPSVNLPTLSSSTFGWIRQLYNITEQQVLASAGLDAFVFLAFFKMAARLFSVMAFFATVVLWPINAHFTDLGKNYTLAYGNNMDMDSSYAPIQLPLLDQDFDLWGQGIKNKSAKQGYLWSYTVFTYVFVALTIYYINAETFRIIRYRQDYLGSQSTITDRTFRLTGIPADLRTEAEIKNLIEKLEIGTVDSVTICRDWRELDDLMELRAITLRKLEASWAKLLKYKRDNTKGDATRNSTRDQRSSNGSQRQDTDEEAGENGHLLNPDLDREDWGEEGRPQVSLRHGFLGLRSQNVDAVDYYGEKLRRLDQQIVDARKKKYTPTDMALVTMDSVASCQMFIQARIDPRPGRLLTKTTPSPSDLVWRNTYAPRGIRRLKSWAVTLFITVLTLVWIFPTAFLASLLSFCVLKNAAPEFAAWLQRHSIIYALVRNGIPTLVVSLLNVAVPYLYDWLSNCQGMISQGDVELSVISKNFFFTFFNTFFVFAVSRTGLDFWSVLQDLLKDTSKIPAVIAADVAELSVFYISFIMLQGIGLMPFRILEVGSVFLYPFTRMMSSTPRDFDDMKQPPIFQYGFYLPTALLVFNLCLIYSVLQLGFMILIMGTLYFALGYFTFKYMVLYAMDQPQHATGGAWRIICYRSIVGLVVFEVVMIGQIASGGAFLQSIGILPLIPFTIWYSFYIKQRFEPLTKYIALRAIRENQDSEEEAVSDEAFDDNPRPSLGVLRRGSTLDEFKEKGMTFVNPSLTVPLQQAWIYDDPPPVLSDDEAETSDGQTPPILAGTDSSLSIGDSHEAECTKTSSQILLSRGVAGATPTRPSTQWKQAGKAPSGIMATVALILDRGRPVDSGPGDVANVQKFVGSDYGVLQLDAERPSSMRLPNETVQQLYLLLSPEDYNSARHTCRSWFLASLDRGLLVRMLKRGGWWSSLLQIITPLNITRLLSLNQERIMSKWISRECALASLKKTAFVEAGRTDFGGLVPGSTVGALHGALVFTVSLCGRFLLATHGWTVYVYELNHVCLNPRSRWSVPLRPRESKSVGLPRPVATVICPRQVISCSMDTSAGRYAVAVLMEGRMGMVCDIMAERVGTSKPTSTNTSNEGSGPSTPSANSLVGPVCICQVNPVFRAPPTEEGPRSVYRRICHADDPPRSVALCPQRNCVAFGWFPLSSPSDFLYFLPARRGIDTGKKLRLISSAAALGSAFGPVGNVFQGFETSFIRSESNGVVSVMDRGSGGTVTHDIHSVNDLSSQRSCVRPRDLLDQRLPTEGFARRVSAGSADHYRAVPLSDGYHILFTDPKTGNLCLGTDAPVGSLNRLIRKVWFRPPAATSSSLPVLYTAGADTRHGVRVAATFSVNSGDPLRVKSDEVTSYTAAPQSDVGSDKQIVVFYTIPPDMFHDISQGSSSMAGSYRRAVEGDEAENLSEWVNWRSEETYGEIDVFGSPFQDSAAYPLEIQGQLVAICSNLVELALDSGPDMVIWAFSAEGWARTWSMHVGREEAFIRAAVQRDGSMRHVDPEGNTEMVEVETASTTSDISGMAFPFPLLDGAEGTGGARWTRWTNPSVERYRRLMAGWEGDRMSGTTPPPAGAAWCLSVRRSSDDTTGGQVHVTVLAWGASVGRFSPAQAPFFRCRPGRHRSAPLRAPPGADCGAPDFFRLRDALRTGGLRSDRFRDGVCQQQQQHSGPGEEKYSGEKVEQDSGRGLGRFDVWDLAARI
ncbi:Calcium permeable stress-gated cation channel 1 [Neonectria ditissima]|uniref:Calcium permeable stress-gated cation channel 1 n=1 Tax=Neonectria ditissima TaxID=78410 RepID=A0A0P7C0B6_9HYPO|nr:Calcium permeable stress-gated cation channel 1 [Neonectria ditissima]